MLIESYINELEDVARKGLALPPNNFMNNFAIVIPSKLLAVINYVRELEKEANWLASYAADHCGCDSKFCHRQCPIRSEYFRTGDVYCSTEATVENWREAARKSIAQGKEHVWDY